MFKASVWVGLFKISQGIFTISANIRSLQFLDQPDIPNILKYLSSLSCNTDNIYVQLSQTSVFRLLWEYFNCLSAKPAWIFLGIETTLPLEEP